ncbi:MAG TPA: hypothetical protein VL400_07200, partial [Polyangiaceae bacterium]|nr:hypothetical protein [Polyangiaceae bacterium]
MRARALYVLMIAAAACGEVAPDDAGDGGHAGAPSTSSFGSVGGGGHACGETGGAGGGGASSGAGAGGSDGGAGGTVDPLCIGAPSGITYAADVAPIFTNCTGELCHVAPTRASTVGVTSQECCDGRVLVEPFAPSRSYLADKVRGVALCSGEAMPYGGPALASSREQAIIGWICAGA